jgi:GntR family transcriptional regulator
VGEQIPTEMALSDQFGVSRETIRKSLKRLEQRDIFRRCPRVGMLLVRRPEVSVDQRLTGPIEEFAELGTATTVKLVGRRFVRAPADVATALGLAAGERVYELKRIPRRPRSVRLAWCMRYWRQGLQVRSWWTVVPMSPDHQSWSRRYQRS